MGPSAAALKKVVLATLLAVSPAVAAASSTQPTFRGLALKAALEQLRADGLDLVYSDNLVRPDMRVSREPAGETPRQKLDALLAEHGLVARDGPDGMILVVEAPRSVRHGTLRGTVRAQDTGSAMAGVEVIISEAGLRVWTQRDGGFELTELPAGIYTIEARIAGYLPQRVDDVTLVAGVTTTTVLELVPNPRFLHEEVVTPSRYEFLHPRPESGQFLDRSEVQRLPHLSDDPMRIVHRLPGIAAGDISAQFAVRGGAPEDLMVILDGQQIYEPYHLRDFFSPFSVIDSEATGGIELLSGGFPAEHGDRMGGVLQVVTADPNERKYSLGFGLLASRALSQGTWGEGSGSWLVSARYGYLDWVLHWVDSIDQGTDLSSSPSYYDLCATVTNRVGKRGVLSAHLLASRDGMDFGTVDGSDQGRSSHSSLYLWGNLHAAWEGGLSARTVLSYAEDSRSLDGSSESENQGYAEAFDRRSFQVLAVRQDGIFEPSRSHLVKWGVDVRRATASYDHNSHAIVIDPVIIGSGPPIVRDHKADLDPSGWQIGAYTADRFRIVPGITAEVGMRWDRQTWTPGDDQLSPRLNLVWESTRFGVVRASWGRFAQSQGIWELPVEDGVTAYSPAEWATHRVLSWERLMPSGLVVRAETYSKTMTDLWPIFENLFEVGGFLPAGAYDRVRLEPVRAEARGLELVLKRPGQGRWWWWASYTLSAVEDLIDGEWQPRSWDQRHAVNFSVNWQPGSAWNLNIAGTIHSGWPKTPVSAQLVQQPDGTWQIVPERGARNSDRYPMYRRLDLRVSRTLPLGRGQLRLFFDVANLTNAENIRATSRHTFSHQGDGVVANDPDFESWVPILPSVGVVWEF